MSIGQIILILVSVLVAAGVCQRALDRLRLTDRQALLFVALIFIGGLLPDISIGRARVNVGGALVPFGLAVYVWARGGQREGASACAGGDAGYGGGGVCHRPVLPQ